MPKEKAQEKYSDAIANGHTAVNLSSDEMNPDIIKLAIGKIFPEEEITIIIKYVKLLEIHDSSWCFRIPLTYTPLYDESRKVTVGPKVKTQSKIPYKWHLNVNINSTTPITRLTSLTHKLAVSFKENKTIGTASFVNEKQPLDSDFILLYRNQSFSKPSIILQKSPEYNEYAALVSFCPSFSDRVDIESETVDTNPTNVYRNDDHVNGSGEFIFVLDCSGSMRGTKIELALSALKMFLHSLPINCMFNIVAFGNRYVFYSEESVRYDANKIGRASCRERVSSPV